MTLRTAPRCQSDYHLSILCLKRGTVLSYFKPPPSMSILLAAPPGSQSTTEQHSEVTLLGLKTRKVQQLTSQIFCPSLPTEKTPTDCCKDCFPAAALNHRSAHTDLVQENPAFPKEKICFASTVAGPSCFMQTQNHLFLSAVLCSSVQVQPVVLSDKQDRHGAFKKKDSARLKMEPCSDCNNKTESPKQQPKCPNAETKVT